MEISTVSKVVCPKNQLIMRGLTVLLAFLGAAAALTVVPTLKDHKLADGEFLLRQKKVFELFSHVTQQTKFPEITKMGREYRLEADMEKYTKVKAVKEFWMMHKEGLLPKGKIFSIFNKDMRKEAIALFHVFFYAKDFETFHKAACWAREHVNEGMFVYSLTVAALHRKDLRGIVLPPIYEIYPYYFVNNDIIEKAQRIKMQEGIIDDERVKDLVELKDDKYVINANYTGKHVKHNHEQTLSYFTEDIGLNAYYYYFHTDYPFWMGGEEHGLMADRRGELYYYIHQQLLARYHLERLTNDLGDIPLLSWRWPVKTGYRPSLKYHNGLEFPVRSNNFDLYTPEKLWHLKEIEHQERLIRDIIAKGHITLTDGTKCSFKDPETIDVVGQMFQQNPDIMDKVNRRVFHYYTVISRVVLGASRDDITDREVIPSVLEQFETSLRDPVFWQLYKRIIRHMITFKRHLTPYTREELVFDGVTVNRVDVDKLVTYFDTFEWDITNSVYLTKEELTKDRKHPIFHVRQPRLNHRPFDVKIDVTADKTREAVVRIFLGPRLDSYGKIDHIDRSHFHFVELDKFLIKLQSGKNSIVRNSREFWHTAKDRTSTHELYKEIMTGKDFVLDRTEMHSFFPNRLLLPKGTKGGFPLRLYVIVSPWISPKVEYGTGFNPIYQNGVGTGARLLDNRALGFPLDRSIECRTLFREKNMHWKEVQIYHMGQDYTRGVFNFRETKHDH